MYYFYNEYAYMSVFLISNISEICRAQCSIFKKN